MAFGEFIGHIRLMTPVLLSFMAWIVWRAPYQERANRALAAFLTVLAAGFWLEVLWDQTRGSVPAVADPARAVQEVLGYLDPPLLLAFALVLTSGASRVRDWIVWPLYAVVGLFLWTAAATESLVSAETFAALRLVYINGSYATAFLLLLLAYSRERRTFVSRQLRYLVLGVGLAAFSRMSGLFQRSGPLFDASRPIEVEVVQSLAVSLGTLVAVAALGMFLGRRARVSTARLWRTTGLLAVILVGFFSVWFLLATTSEGTTFASFPNQFFAFRWIAFAAIVGYGVLKYQLFDFDVRARQVAALFGVTATSVVVAMTLSWTLAESGWTLIGARATGLLVAMVVGVLVFIVVDRVGRSLEQQPGQAHAGKRRRLEIYQATLEFAVEKPAWSADERRFVETLREVFEVTPEEHQEVLRRLRLAGEPVRRA